MAPREYSTVRKGLSRTSVTFPVFHIASGELKEIAPAKVLLSDTSLYGGYTL